MPTLRVDTNHARQKACLSAKIFVSILFPKDANCVELKCLQSSVDIFLQLLFNKKAKKRLTGISQRSVTKSVNVKTLLP